MKELFAAIILITLIILGFFNCAHVNTFTAEMNSHVITAIEKSSSSENVIASTAEIISAYRIWDSKQIYCKMMLRYDDVESVNNAFFDIFTTLEDGNLQISQFEALSSKIASLSSNEKLTLSSIF